MNVSKSRCILPTPPAIPSASGGTRITPNEPRRVPASSGPPADTAPWLNHQSIVEGGGKNDDGSRSQNPAKTQDLGGMFVMV